jgi:cyclopropane fatty-acyl-phospholipid synthase-like methyltransferase
VARFKAEALNQFVVEHHVESVLEFGCGDGHQLSLASYPRYIGLDVSRTAVSRCAELFAADTTKSFLLYHPMAFINHDAIKADIAVSLDVILHLVEDEVFDTHMRHLFGAAARYVAVFSSNREAACSEPHVRHRIFTSWVEAHAPDWQMLGRVVNPYKGGDSLADFYFYVRA